ncbi:uncharacterized protein LOC125498644 [Beta vulgaris subsp. vulgaris]|uniref:uncharacterized protein LOC125498644 n=1 Tax=Beta vulgaris subsp. vulgaris TaxID=3555 RepID=UPI002036F89F|nr:uncharacterized protein LOC125498644 [Beta vulgaris subsp. vulgaris]
MDLDAILDVKNTILDVETLLNLCPNNLEASRLVLEHQARTGESRFYCPCVKCGNVVKVSDIDLLREHVLHHGFRPEYHVWIWHGEEGVYERNSHANDVHEQEDVTHAFGEMGNDNEHEDDEDDEDHVDEMMASGEDDLGKHSLVFESLTEAAQKPLYPGCKKFTKLSAVLTLFNIKSKGNWTDISFYSMLEVLGEMFPDGNELPKSTYYARKLMCPFGLEYKKIHACPNDCVLYRNEYDNFDKCPRCEMSRYKHEGDEDKKEPPTKVLWYLPIIPRFKRLFSIKKDAKYLRWHANRREKDGLLKHPADSLEWNSINRLHKPFGDEDRNLRLGLCTDGMNPSKV